MCKKLLIFGLSKYTELVEHYFTTYDGYEVIGYTVNEQYLTETTYRGKPVVPFESIENYFSPTDCQVFIAVGITQMNEARKRLLLEFEQKGYSFATFVHPKAMVDPTATIGPHCIIMENVVIQAFCTVGKNVIFFPGAALTHHSTLGDHAFMSSGVVVGGCTTIGEGTFLGISSTSNDYKTIGSGCFISSGSIVTENLPDATLLTREGTKMKLTNTTKKLLYKMLGV